MPRFTFKELEPLAEVVAAPGKHYEETFEVPVPVGKFWGDTALKLLEIVNKFGSRMDNPENRAQATIDAFNDLRGSSEFWKDLLPAVLGYKRTNGSNKPGTKDLADYFDNWCTNTEIVELFMEASVRVVNYSFGAEETEEAVAKLEGGEVVEGEVVPLSDGSTPPP